MSLIALLHLQHCNDGVVKHFLYVTVAILLLVLLDQTVFNIEYKYLLIGVQSPGTF
jgi:hypothetical protein